MWKVFAAALVIALSGVQVITQRQLSPGYLDPTPILADARQAIGTDKLRCVTIAGTAYGGALGQARESARNTDWPRIDAMANYTRTMNWDNWTMKEEFDRKPGLNPAGWKYGIGWEDGAAPEERASDVHAQRHARVVPRRRRAPRPSRCLRTSRRSFRSSSS